jgi:hypothetical protein
MSTPASQPYVPPVGDEPLDAIEQVLVRMWIDIIAAEIRAELAAEQRRDASNDAATTGELEQQER